MFSDWTNRPGIVLHHESIAPKSSPLRLWKSRVLFSKFESFCVAPSGALRSTRTTDMGGFQFSADKRGITIFNWATKFVELFTQICNAALFPS